MFQENVQTQCPPGMLYSVQNTLRLPIKQFTVMVSGVKDTLPHKRFTFSPSSFSLCSVHFSKTTVVGPALEASEWIRAANAFKPHLLFSEKADGLRKILTALTRKAL